MIYVSFAEQYKKVSFSVIDRHDYIRSIRMWLRTNIGEEWNDWQWNQAPCWPPLGVDFISEEDAIMFRLRFGV